MPHLLVTNDFPPKVGGIQSYLWELWRRVPPESFAVLTTPQRGAAAFDAEQAFRIERIRPPVLLPTPSTARAIDALADEIGAGIVVLDPALPLGLIGPRLRHRYAVVVHGAEVTVPGRLPVSRQLLARVLRGATHVIAAGSYPAAEARRAAGGRVHLDITEIPPGVDVDRFGPIESDERRAAARDAFGLPVDGRMVVSVSRLVPRKGMDVLIDAAARLAPARPDLTVAIAGDGRDRRRLAQRIARRDAPVKLLGRVADGELPMLYGAADAFAMACRSRWGGLEQEGFGIVFLEAAACGVPQVAGDSGGAAEAVADGETGFVVGRPEDDKAVATALARLLDDEPLRRSMGQAARARAERCFSYDGLAARLDAVLSRLG